MRKRETVREEKTREKRMRRKYDQKAVKAAGCCSPYQIRH
jgi:hypothetical protein